LTVGDFYNGAKGALSLSKDNLLTDVVPVVVKESMQSNARTKVKRLGFNGGIRYVWWNLFYLDANTTKGKRGKQTDISRRNVVTR
jgi:hypothetical protein